MFFFKPYDFLVKADHSEVLAGCARFVGRSSFLACVLAGKKKTRDEGGMFF